MTFLPGDKVRVKRGDVYQRYTAGLYGDLRLAAEVWHIPGYVHPPCPDTPAGHHVVIFQHTLSYTEMTIPSQDLVLVSKDVLA